MSVRKTAGWFPGPRAENAEPERAMLARILEDYLEWRRSNFPSDQPVIRAGLCDEAAGFHKRLGEQVDEMLAGLRNDFPFYSPRYIGHMISDQTLPSILGYFAGLLYNPNNVTPESSPVTLGWELEVGADILRMVGYTPPPAGGRPSKEEFGWAHVTSGGTVANLEALWLARSVRYFPLAVRDACQRHGIEVALNLRGHPEPLCALSPEVCLGAAPGRAIDLYADFIGAVRRHWNLAHSEAIRVAHELLRDSRYSIAHQGAGAAYGVRPPVLLVSGARHYSITKAADLLGIGRENIVLVDVDEHFRMDLRDLEAKLKHAAKGDGFRWRSSRLPGPPRKARSIPSIALRLWGNTAKLNGARASGCTSMRPGEVTCALCSSRTPRPGMFARLSRESWKFATARIISVCISTGPMTVCAPPLARFRARIRSRSTRTSSDTCLIHAAWRHTGTIWCASS